MSSIFLFTPKLLLDLQNMNSVLKSSIYKVSDRSTVQKAKQQCNSRSSNPERIFSVGVGNQIHRGLFFFFIKYFKDSEKQIQGCRASEAFAWCLLCLFILSVLHSFWKPQQNKLGSESTVQGYKYPRRKSFEHIHSSFFFLPVPFVWRVIAKSKHANEAVALLSRRNRKWAGRIEWNPFPPFVPLSPRWSVDVGQAVKWTSCGSWHLLQGAQHCHGKVNI